MLERKVAMFTEKLHVNSSSLEVRYQILRVPFSTGSEVENILSVGGYSAPQEGSENYFKTKGPFITRPT